jgi:hypothetical protein
VVLPFSCHPISARPVDRGEAFGHDAGMNCHDLTPEQCDALAAKFGAMQAELGRILKRMEKRRFPANDELQQLTREAFDKLQHLKMKAHYLGCTGFGTQRGINGGPGSPDAPAK